MSTVRQHLGLLWLVRRNLMTSNPQYDKAWAEQAALFVGVHLNELIELAGGAEIEQWVREQAAEIPNDFPFATPAAIEQAGAQPVAQALPTDEQITEIARVAVGAGELNWAGYKANTDGKYTIPAISPMEFGLCRAVVRALAAPTPATDQDALEPVEGDLLPPVGSKVLIHLARQDEWVEHTVAGYYVWGALSHQVRDGEKDAHRVFVRVKDANGYDNARLLSGVKRAATPVTDQPKQENQQ